MIVYGSSLSPYVRKVLVICAEKRIEAENQVFGPGTPPSPEFIEASPFKKIPALRDGGFVLSDSTAIAVYLDAKHPEPQLIPTEPQARGRTMWFDEFADTIALPPKAKVFWNRVVAPLMGQAGDEDAATKAETTELPDIFAYLERTVAGERLPGGGPLHPGRRRGGEPLRQPAPRQVACGRLHLSAPDGLSRRHPCAAVVRCADR